jgi:hypothetical protein
VDYRFGHPFIHKKAAEELRANKVGGLSSDSVRLPILYAIVGVRHILTAIILKAHTYRRFCVLCEGWSVGHQQPQYFG